MPLDGRAPRRAAKRAAAQRSLDEQIAAEVIAVGYDGVVLGDGLGERRTYLFFGYGEEPRAGVCLGAILLPDAEVVAASEAFPARAEPDARGAGVDQAAVLEQLRHPPVAVSEVGVLQAAEVDV